MLKVGIVGLKRGMTFVDIAKIHPEVKLVAVCDLDESKVEAAAKIEGVEAGYTDYYKFLEHDLDIVVLATSISDHVSHTISALELDRHVLCEVTAVHTIDESELLVNAVKASKGKYMMAENCYFWAFIDSWDKIVRQGRLGEIMYAEAEYIHDVRYLMKDSKGNPTWRASMSPIHYCTHSLGPLLRIMDDRCVSVSGLHTGAKIFPQYSKMDMEVGIFKTQKGAVIKVLAGFALCREPHFHYYSMYGTKGCLETKRPGNGEGTLAYFEDTPNLNGMISLPFNDIHPWANRAWRIGHGTADYLMFNAFVRSIINNAEPPVDVYKALDYTLPGLCAHISAERGGESVTIPDFR